MSLWGNTDVTNDKPKNLTTAQKSEVFFVDLTEAASSANRAKGIKTPGWNRVTTHTDAQGQQRTKVEVLVALAATAVAAGDAADDTVVGDANLTISTQPVSVTKISGESTSFSVVASDMGGTFQWQVKVGTAQYANVTDAGVYSGATTSTLTISDVMNLETNKYRVVVLNTAGNTTVISKPATLTVNYTFAISIDTQPANLTEAAGQPGAFTVVASTTNSGVEAYQWQLSTDSGASWANIADAGVYSTATTDSLTISSVTGLDGNQYRVVVSGTGASTVTSTAATLTVTA